MRLLSNTRVPSFARSLTLIAIAALLGACGETPMMPDVRDVRSEGGQDAADVPAMDVQPEAGCPTGQQLCGSTCIDTRSDNSNCGACRNVCPAGVGCVGGACNCNPPNIVCDGVCLNPQSETAHCGRCGNACAMGQVCAFGMCTANCAAPNMLCSSMGTVTCADTMTDAMNCGGCGVRCNPGYTCTAGRCACGMPRMMCGATCADLQTDVNNCGMCDNGCGTTGVCMAGTCMCLTGGTRCGSTCADLMTDTNHCGMCNNICAMGQTCMGGRCVCMGGLTGCGAICVDTNTNSNHCGTCGNVCPPTSGCTAGRCVCPTGQTACSGMCTNTMTDVNNCGACGTSCGAGGACSAGRCMCAAGYTMCGAACSDVRFDRNNCGACGRVCPATQLCVSGACTAAPPTRYTFTRGTLPFVDVCSSPGAVRLLMGVDDVVGAAQTLPFMFPFFGRPYTTVRPTSNGYVIFGSTPNTYDNSYYPTMMLPDPARPRPAAYIYNSDLWQRATGGVCVATLGSAPSRRFVVQTVDAAMCCGDTGADHFTFELILNEADGTMDYVYQNIVHAPMVYGNYLIGVQNETAMNGSTFQFSMASRPSMIMSPMSLHLVPAP